MIQNARHYEINKVLHALRRMVKAGVGRQNDRARDSDSYRAGARKSRPVETKAFNKVSNAGSVGAI
jgi:hypothetical protein